MVFFNNTDKTINFSIGARSYSVASGSEFNLNDNIARIAKNRLLSFGLSLEKNLVQTPKSETPIGESSSEPAPSLEESAETSTEEAPKRRGRKKKEE